MMQNRDIYQKDPAKRKLVNEGVASVNDEKTSEAMAVLRYELETFVCDGQYQKGLEDVLEIYLKNIEEAQQPAVWVSGFYGSGKSHLVKMLRALWVDTQFEDGAHARGIATLPKNITDQLKELNTKAKRYGGLHAASGTLGAGARGSVRLALLRIIFKSLDLPEQYHTARFVMWLKREKIYDEVRKLVEEKGYNWQEELENFHVAEGLYEALCQVKPNIFSKKISAVEILPQLYPNVQDISSDEMVNSIRHALTRDGKFPLTVIVLDEVQQYIGEDSQRSSDVQEAVEACCKNIGSKLLFIGTGQTAVTGTSNLKKLEGRFTIRVELSDTDVNAVIRKVILAKKANAIAPIEQMMQINLGEISRHLSNTTFGHRQEDPQYFAQDYPILPVRRRFWEETLHILDPTGTDSQLRNQLSMIHKVIQTNLDEPLGYVVPADYLYFDSADKLLQSRILPRKVHEKTMIWIKGTDDEKLMARACGLVFLINKLAGHNKEIGIKATIDTLADLMVEDLSEGSSGLRSKLPGVLSKCELLMKVGDEYRIQTEESAAWNDEFLLQRNILANATVKTDTERDDRIRARFGELVKQLKITQGNSKESRDIHPVLSLKLPDDFEKKVCVWVRDGWSVDENSVRSDARQAGNQAPTIFVFIPKRSADDLRHNLIEYKAAIATLEKRGVPKGAEGMEAHGAMETIKQSSDGKIRELLDEAFSGAHVFQAGGNEILGNNLQETILEAANNAMQRLYPQFHIADHPGWAKVYARAQKGSPDALKAVDFDGEPAKNPVCKAILGFIAGGKKGHEIRSHFEAADFGWPQDAIDGALQVLLIAGLIRGQDERGKLTDPKDLERKAIGKAIFKIESASVTTPQRIQIRKLMQKIGIQAKQGEEITFVPQFLQRMVELANKAGGDAPKPNCPDTTLLNEIRLTAGNEQLLALFNSRDDLTRNIDDWTELKEKIEERWPSWEALQDLLRHARGIEAAEDVQQQVQVIELQRHLLVDPDLILPLIQTLEDSLRREINAYYQRYASELKSRMEQLESNSSWKALEKERQDEILQMCEIIPIPDPMVGTREDLIQELDNRPIQGWSDRVDALAGRFTRVLEIAAKDLEPETQTIEIPHRILKTNTDIEIWVQEVKEKLKAAIKKGPIVIR